MKPPSLCRIKSLEKDSTKLETPISVSLDLQMLRQSDNPEERSLADVLSVVSELRSSLSAIEKRLDAPEGLIPPVLIRELMGRREDRSVRVREMLIELKHLLRVAQNEQVEKGKTVAPGEIRDELAKRMDQLITMLMHDREIYRA